MNYARFAKQLEFFEDRRRYPYVDTRGKVTIGVGRNLTDRGIPEELIDQWLGEDMQEATSDLDRKYPWWRSLDEVRQRILADMRFNMGPKFLVRWPIFFGQVKRGEWEAAARNMEGTPWYRQVGRRGPILVRMMRTGIDSTAF